MQFLKNLFTARESETTANRQMQNKNRMENAKKRLLIHAVFALELMRGLEPLTY